MLRLVVLRVLCCSTCLFLYRQFCHGALKLDLSTLFTTFFFLLISLQIIVSANNIMSANLVFSPHDLRMLYAYRKDRYILFLKKKCKQTHQLI